MGFLAILSITVALYTLTGLSVPAKSLDLSRLDAPGSRKCDLKQPTPTKQVCGSKGSLTSAVPYSAGTVHHLNICSGACLQSSPQKGIGSEFPCKSYSYDQSSGLCQLYTFEAEDFFEPESKNSTEVFSFHCYECPLDCSSSPNTVLVNTTACVKTTGDDFLMRSSVDSLTIGDQYVISFEYKVVVLKPDGKLTSLSIDIGDLVYDDVHSDFVNQGTDDSFVPFYASFTFSKEFTSTLDFEFTRPKGTNKFVYIQNVSLFPAPPIHPSATELMQNPSFETGSIKPWKIKGFPRSGLNISVVQPGIRGKYSLSVTSKNPNAVFIISQNFTSVPGKRYVVRYRLQNDRKDAPSTSVDSLVTEEGFFPITTTPVLHERVFTASLTSNKLKIGFEADTLVDDISIREMPS